MNHPSGYYIKYLLAASWGEEDQLDITGANQTLEDAGLPAMTENQFDYLRSTFSPPEGFRFNSKKHKPTIDFMKAEKIWSVWDMTKVMGRVMNEIIGDANRLVREPMHVLLMGGLTCDFIADKLNNKFRLVPAFTADMVDHYKHYFWRVQSLSERDWETFLQVDPHKDRYLAALLGGEQQALFRAGFNPKYDMKFAIRDLYRQIAFRVQYSAHKEDDRYVISSLMMMGREIRAIYEILRNEGGGLEEQYREVRRFMMEHKITDIKQLQELMEAGDTYSGDGTAPSKIEKKAMLEIEDGKKE